MTRGRASVFTSALLALALLALAATTTYSLVAISRANARVLETRVVVTAYLDLQQAVSKEAFAEAGYRRAPSDAARQRLETAIAAVPAAVADTRMVGDHEDGPTLSYVETLNRRYVAEVRATLDDPPGQRTNDRVAGPALDAMQRLLISRTEAHRIDAKKQVLNQASLVSTLEVVLPLVFLIAFAMVGWTWRLMVGEHRRLAAVAADDRRRAHTDALTGLPNRTGLRIPMEQALARPRTEAALLYLDLDRFKPVNDTLGHHAGDEVLREVARRLTGTIRAGEVAARLGGDEFAVFLPRGRDAVGVAERILDAFRLPFEVEGRSFDVGTSIGVARSPHDGEDCDTLLMVADRALYEAKGRGRGTVHVAGAVGPAPVTPLVETAGRG